MGISKSINILFCQFLSGSGRADYVVSDWVSLGHETSHKVASWSNLKCKHCQDMPKICQDMPRLCPRNAQDMP